MQYCATLTTSPLTCRATINIACLLHHMQYSTLFLVDSIGPGHCHCRVLANEDMRKELATQAIDYTSHIHCASRHHASILITVKLLYLLRHMQQLNLAEWAARGDYGVLAFLAAVLLGLLSQVCSPHAALLLRVQHTVPWPALDACVNLLAS